LQNIVGTGEINYSLWSIATELHIYAGFPLLVKVLSKRGGWFLALLGVLISFALSFLLLETRLSRAYVHLAGAFIVGVGASWVVSGDHNHNFTNILRKISKPVAVGVMTLVVAWTIILPRSLYKPFILPHDFLVMIGIGAVLIWCASISGFGRKLLELKPLVWLGERSYSLYLLHVPIQAALLKVAINSLDLTHTERLVFSLTVGFGILLGLTWVFHRFVEIPAMALSRGVAQHRLVRT
jgi:peptidoglycan/LPS O-acetylase OafA/YrhL